ncbi:MAG: GNAT superfamily N-acetyltransferase [Verrucomicrobiales bacterium]|jgi:GNAT superfamily N-acetyltransferase
MALQITSVPDLNVESQIIEGVRAFNREILPSDKLPLCVFDRSACGELLGGLIGKTYWNYLEINYLWVSESCRGEGRAASMLKAAEDEAIKNACSHAFLNTFSFQALGFYRKMGYDEFGYLPDFAEGHSRHFLHKLLVQNDE